MAKFAPDPLWTALREAGLADDSTRRVVIDVQSGHLPVVHTERLGDERLLGVVAIAGRVEVVRDQRPFCRASCTAQACPTCGRGSVFTDCRDHWHKHARMLTEEPK